VPEVRLVGSDGSQIGVVSTRDAIGMAIREGLDLVEIAPNAQPPVCRIMDFGKYKYEKEKKERESRKHQVATKLKEVQFHANVEPHDYDTKLRKMKGFILEGHRVKVSLYFRGRENAHKELGYELLNRVTKDCDDVAQVDQNPLPMGRSLIMMMGPKRGLRKQLQVQARGGPRPVADAPPAAPNPVLR